MILTCLGGVGVVATSVMAVKATPKASQLVDVAKEEKGEDLTKWETVKVAGPAYIPSVLMGTTTLACIFGANVLNKRAQAALTSAYALLDQSYKEYKNIVVELYGDESEAKIREEIAKDHLKEENIEEEDDGKLLFYDEFSKRYFRTTNEDILRAEYEINKMLTEDGCVALNELYELLDLPTVDYGDYVGWSSAQMFEMYWSSWINFRQEKFETDDGLEGHIFIFTEPMIDFDEY